MSRRFKGALASIAKSRTNCRLTQTKYRIWATRLHTGKSVSLKLVISERFFLIMRLFGICSDSRVTKPTL